MNLPSRSTQADMSAALPRVPNTRLQGPWLPLLRLAWVLLSLLTFSVFIASLPVYFAGQQTSYPVGYAIFLLALGVVIALIWFIVALLIFWRKSNDWMALLVAFLLVTQGANSTISPLDTVPSIWQVPAKIEGVLAFVLLVLVFSLFPTGRFVPRWISWCAVLFLGWQVVWSWDLLPDGSVLLYILVWYGFLGIFVTSQLYRYHSVSNAVERQQTKWIVFGVTGTYLIELGITVSYAFFSSPLPNGSLGDLILTPLGNAVPILIPLSFGFAILRYRLWEIDVIIKRTLVYATLTAMLALVYFGLVLALQSLVRALTGQVSQSSLVLVASTLAIAGLFQPLRHRIQAIIDRRFYRRKYDAAKTLATFAATLHNEVDLSQLSERLITVVQETMQPMHVSLWLRPHQWEEKQTTRVLPRLGEEERRSP